MNLIDAPIRSASEDLLDRERFARLVANALLSDVSKDGIVMSINGSWGSGKTSVATMIADVVEVDLNVVHFNPWMITTREALAQEFFSTIAKAVLPRGEGREAAAVRARFYGFWEEVTGITAIGLSAIGTADTPVAAKAGLAALWISKVFGRAGKASERLMQKPSLHEYKERVSKDLQKLDRRVLIVIDDLDRLDSTEVRMMLQLVKICGGFPNLCYLMLFDRIQVEKALEGTDSAAFLEKIVNQFYDLPEPTTEQRARLLESAIQLLGLEHDLPKGAHDRLEIVFEGVLLPGLTTIRQVKRFVSTVATLLPGVIENGFRNVDPADYLVLEFLRQYTPTVYSVLRNEKSPNAGGLVERLANYEQIEKDTIVLREQAIAGLDQPLRAVANEALNRLLEVTRKTAAVSNRRFNTDYWRPVYFGFSDARATIREAEWVTILNTLDEPLVTAVWLNTWSDRHWRDRVVTAFTLRSGDLTPTQRKTLLTELFRWGENQPYERSRISGPNLSWDDAVEMCAEAILDETADTEREELIRDAGAESGAVLPVGVVLAMEMTSSPQGTRRWLTQEGFDKLLGIYGIRLAEEIETGLVWQRADPHTALVTWSVLYPERAKEWNQEMLKDEDKMAAYLNHYLGCLQEDSDQLDWQTDPSRLAAFSSVNRSLLTTKGLWALEHMIKSSDRLSGA